MAGGEASSFLPSERDPATYVSLQDDLVWKLRLAVLQGINPGSLFDEWMTVHRLRHHPAVWSSPHAYRAADDWELLELERVAGAPLGDAAGLSDQRAVYRILLRSIGVIQLKTAHC